MFRSLVAALTLFACPSFAAEPAFDCPTATTEMEQAVCDTDILAELDQEFDLLLRAALAAGDLPESGFDWARTDPRGWLKRLDHCKTARIGATPCVANSYVLRIARLRANSAAARAMQTASVGPMDLTCDGLDPVLQVVFVNTSAPMVSLTQQAEGWGWVMPAVVSASGARYEAPFRSVITAQGAVWRGLTQLWTKGDSARLVLSGGPDLDCTLLQQG